MPGGATRRFSLLLVVVAGFIVILYITSFRNPLERGGTSSGPSKLVNQGFGGVHPDLLSGHAIAPKLGNETAKKELGNAAWKVLHTTFARFPDKPTKEESQALDTYIHLFQRLYPCGECAEHFGRLIEKFPPQTSSRSVAAAWGCHIHNEVNKRLRKDLFDCSKIGDFYDCGCADKDDDPKLEKKAGEAGEKKPDASAKPSEKEKQEKDKVPASSGRRTNEGQLKLEKEGYQRGG